MKMASAVDSEYIFNNLHHIKSAVGTNCKMHVELPITLPSVSSNSEYCPIQISTPESRSMSVVALTSGPLTPPLPSVLSSSDEMLLSDVSADSLKALSDSYTQSSDHLCPSSSDHLIEHLPLKETNTNILRIHSSVQSATSELDLSHIVGSQDMLFESCNSDIPTKFQKLNHQFVVKLIDCDNLNLDVVRILNEGSTMSPDQSNLSLISHDDSNSLVLEDDRDDVDGSLPCLDSNFSANASLSQVVVSGASPSTAWFCDCCHKYFVSEDAARKHQTVCCLDAQNVGFAAESLHSESQVDFHSLKMNLSPEISRMKDEDKTVELCWTCAVCKTEFTEDKKLKEHYMLHTKEKLVAALMELNKPVSKNSLANKNEPKEFSENDTKFKKTIPHAVLSETSVSNSLKSNEILLRSKRKPKLLNLEDKKANCSGNALKQDKKSYLKFPSSRDPHPCAVCGKVLSCRGNLVKHLIQHQQEKPWVCEICGQGFNSKRNYKHHYLQRHTNERPYTCKICGKGFVDSNYIEGHMVFHRKKREFMCDICGKGFQTSKCLNRHKSRHDRQKKHVCPQCLRAFTVKCDLLAHIRKIHNKEKKKNQRSIVEDSKHNTALKENQLRNSNEFIEIVNSKSLCGALIPVVASETETHTYIAVSEENGLTGSLIESGTVFVVTDQEGKDAASELSDNMEIIYGTNSDSF